MFSNIQFLFTHFIDRVQNLLIISNSTLYYTATHFILLKKFAFNMNFAQGMFC